MNDDTLRTAAYASLCVACSLQRALEPATRASGSPERIREVRRTLDYISKILEPLAADPPPPMEIVPKGGGFDWSNCRGFSLLETLIAAFVLAIGVLGLAALTLVSKSALHDSLMRTQAVFAANQIVEVARSLALSPGRTACEEMNGTYSSIDDLPAESPYGAAISPSEQASEAIRTAYMILDGSNVRAGTANVGGIISPVLCIQFDNATSRFQLQIAWAGRAHTVDAHISDCGRNQIENGRRRLLTVDTLLPHGNGGSS